MPHKDRATRLAYLAAHHAANRPPPAPEPQPHRGDLPPRGTLIYDDDGGRVQCHVCGEFFQRLAMHVRGHGLDGTRYREQYGLARTTSLDSPARQERQRQAALARDQGAIGRKALAEIEPAPRPKGVPNRLQSQVRSSEAKRDTYRGRPRKPVDPPQPPRDMTGYLTVKQAAGAQPRAPTRRPRDRSPPVAL